MIDIYHFCYPISSITDYRIFHANLFPLTSGSLSASMTEDDLVVGHGGHRKTHMSASLSRSVNKNHCK